MHGIWRFDYSFMSAYARHCLHSTHDLPNTSAFPLQGRGYHAHTAVRNLSLEKLSSLSRARILTQSNQAPKPFFYSLLDHTFPHHPPPREEHYFASLEPQISLFLLTYEVHIGPCWPLLQVRYKFLLPQWAGGPVCDWPGIKVFKSSSWFDLPTVQWAHVFHIS